MASKTVALNDEAYTKLDTGSGTALEVQNVSSVKVFVRFSATEPSVVSPLAGFALDPGDNKLRGTIAGDMWAICEGAALANVEVGE